MKHCVVTVSQSTISFCFLSQSTISRSCVLLGVLVQSLKPVKLLATCKRMQQLTNNVGICCVRFYIGSWTSGRTRSRVSIFLPRKNNHLNQPLLLRTECAFAREVDSFRFRFTTLQPHWHAKANTTELGTY